MECNCHHHSNTLEFQPKAGAATKVLRHEHEAVLLVLDIFTQATDRLRRGEEVSFEMMDGLVEFLAIFVDKCHHSKEEELLFPMLREAGIPQENGPIGCMLSEHEIGRSYIRKLKEGLAQFKAGDKAGISTLAEYGERYAELMTEHIAKENNVLFVMADRVLGSGTQEELAEQFEDIETSKLGVGTHERLHGMIDQWQVTAREWALALK
jgi:hemerythrin-like domain-containing protein